MGGHSPPEDLDRVTAESAEGSDQRTVKIGIPSRATPTATRCGVRETPSIRMRGRPLHGLGLMPTSPN